MNALVFSILLGIISLLVFFLLNRRYVKNERYKKISINHPGIYGCLGIFFFVFSIALFFCGTYFIYFFN